MEEILNEIWAWLNSLSEKHNVNPIIFGSLYAISIPPYLGSMTWLVRNYKQKKELALPILSTLFFFIMPSLYIVLFGRDVAWYVYLIIAFMLAYGLYQAYLKVQKRIHSTEDNHE